jgi:hypothetical protein
MRIHDQDNLIRWDPGDRSGHVESLFLKANDPKRPRAFWLKYTILARPDGRTESYVWAVAFDAARSNVAVRRRYDVLQVEHKSDPFSVTAPDFLLEAGRVSGSVASAGHAVRFDLRHTARSWPHRPYPFDRMYDGPFPRFKILTPYPDELFTGSVVVDGELWPVLDWPGMQGHNWGRAHAERYAWAQCSSFEGAPGTWFEGFSARIRLGPVTTPFVTFVTLRHEGRTYSPMTPVALFAPVDVEHARWRFRAPGCGFTLSGELTATVDHMVGLIYENPAGDTASCLNSKLARCRVRLERSGQPPLELTAEHTAALEVLVRENEHPVLMHL